MPTEELRDPEGSELDVLRRLSSGGPALVALSGGVDSGVVAALAYEALGARALAVTLDGPAVSRAEVARAADVAAAIGIRHLVREADPLARADYRANGADRCYHCRSVETSVLRAVGASEGMIRFLDGIHRDDLSEDRPGLRAMEEAGFEHPLLWAGWGKASVRTAARRRGLPNWATPSNACLASRVARGDPIDADLLRRIEAAESLVHAEGFARVRVRVRANHARIEVDPDEVERLTGAPLADVVAERVRALGFATVTIDPRGYGAGRSALPVVR